MNKNIYLLLLIVAWSGYIIWEYYVQKWAAAQPEGGGAVIRVDLIILLPALIIYTVWSIIKILNKK